MPVWGLYLITPDRIGDTDCWSLTAELLESGTVRWLQYRDKSANPTEARRRADRLRRIAHDTGACFIINDDAALAAACHADGVHLGEDDMSPERARELVGDDAIVGISCYDSLERAQRAIASGADYVAFGACFPSRSKATTRRATPELFRSAREAGWPAVAIGGLDPDNVLSVIEAGAPWVAMIQGIYAAPDPLAAARRVQTLYAQGSDP